MYFVYEKNFANRWQPKIYSTLPDKSVNGNTPERTTFYPIPEDCIVDGKPSFDLLTAKFSVGE